MQQKPKWTNTKIGWKDKEEITVIVEADNKYEAELLARQEANRLGYSFMEITELYNNQWRVQLFNIKRKKHHGKSYSY